MLWLRRTACFHSWLVMLACSTDPGARPGELPNTGGAPGTGGAGATPFAGGGTTGGQPTETGGSAGGETGGAGIGGGTAGTGGSVATGGGETGGAGGAPDVSVLISQFDVYWDFETTDGSSVSPTVGTESLLMAGATLSDGQWDNSVQFSGADSSASSANPVIDTSGDFSISAWIKLDQLADFNTFVGIDGQQLSAVFLQKRNDDRLSFTTFPSDSTAASSCVTTAEIQPRPGEWYYVVGTRDATTREQRIYVDGVLSAKRTCPGDVFSASGGISIGRGLYDGVGSDFVHGGVDNVGLVSRVLSSEEIFDLYWAGQPDANHYLFAYFVEVSQGRGDGLRLAHSHDGLMWGAIGAGKVFMPPSVGGGSFRDPHLLRAPDGMYHLVWTTTCVPWAESNCVQDRGLGHASSPDLVSWSAADYLTIDLNVEHVWAPETFFDEETQQFMVFWSSPVDATSGSDPHSIYYLLTEDFQTYDEPQVLYSVAGRNFIDATIRKDDAGYLMIIKDEADGQKNLRALRSSQLYGAWTGAPSSALSGNYAAEGPSLLEREGELFIYFDKYGEGSYGALRATTDSQLESPSAWEDISSSVFFPGVRHGTPIEVPWEVYQTVAQKAGE